MTTDNNTCHRIKKFCWRSNPKSPSLLFWVFYTLEEQSFQQPPGVNIRGRRYPFTSLFNVEGRPIHFNVNPSPSDSDAWGSTNEKYGCANFANSKGTRLLLWRHKLYHIHQHCIIQGCHCSGCVFMVCVCVHWCVCALRMLIAEHKF